MNMEVVKLAATRGLGRSLLLTKKYAPEILTGVGIVGVIGTTILASKATLKLEETVDVVSGELEELKQEEVFSSENYSEEFQPTDFGRRRAKIYIRGGLEVSKLYGPSVSLGVASVGCIVAAHGIMRKRNVALVAAYNVLEKGFAQYRSRVIDELGLDKDRQFRFGVTKAELTDPETGELVDSYVGEEVDEFDENDVYYAREFNMRNKNWESRLEYNFMFLKCQQNYANDKLHAQGHLFLNEVYDMLGLPRSKAGAVVGWLADGDGDNYIDFHEFQLNHFPDGQRTISIQLDFNVDGVIFDKI